MTSANINLTILGIPLSLKAGADTSRFMEAIKLVEDRYQDQGKRTDGLRQNKEFLLTFVALGLADELLQLKKQYRTAGDRMEELLSYIEQSK